MLKKITGSAITWTAAARMPAQVLTGIEACARDAAIDPGVPFIKDNNVRSVFILKSAAPDVPHLFVKWFKRPSFAQRIKHVFVASKALAEWRNLHLLRERGLPCPGPLAFFEKKTCGVLLDTACLIIECIDNARSLNEFLECRTLASTQSFELTRQLARLSAAMHSAGVLSRDFHAGNIMIRDRAPGFELFLIDMHRAQVVKQPPAAMIINDLAQLANSITCSRSAQLRFLQEYYRCAGLPGMPITECLRLISHRAARLAARRIKSRSRRCVLNSSVFEVARSWHERYCGRRDFGHNAAHELIDQHLHSRAEATVVKQSSKSALTFHGLPDRPTVCVKGFYFRGAFAALLRMFQKSRALKSWVAANGLIVRGLRTPQPLALIEKRFGPLVRDSYYICRRLDHARELNTLITARQWTRADKKNFIRGLARTVAELHAKGIYHADLKSNNILVLGNGHGWDFYFIDLDRVSFTKPLTFARRANNLAQINASVADVMTVRDRLYFFRIYSRAASCYTERKRYFERILAISRTKITHPYGLHVAR